MKAGVVYILIYVSGCDRTSVRGTQRLFSVISAGRNKHCLDFSITLACVAGAWKWWVKERTGAREGDTRLLLLVDGYKFFDDRSIRDQFSKPI